MQRSDSVKWFWPFMMVAAVAAATVIALPPFQAKANASATPQFRMQLTVVGEREPHATDRSVVAIEPYRIQVTAKRVTLLDRLAEHFAQRKTS